MSKSDLIKMWRSRIEEIEQTGNCLNGNTVRPEQFFSGRRMEYSKEEMVQYCEQMIKRIENED